MSLLNKTLTVLLAITLLTPPLLAVHAQAVQSVQLESLQDATMSEPSMQREMSQGTP
jgi:hypothetical protein